MNKWEDEVPIYFTCQDTVLDQVSVRIVGRKVFYDTIR